jgi:serine/threonine protein kinase
MPEKPVKFSKNPGTPGYMAPEQLKREGIDGRDLPHFLKRQQ